MGEVITKDWDGYNRSGFRKVAEQILLPFFPEGIIISVPHAETREVADDEYFHIFIWSAPPDADEHIIRDVSTPKYIYGIPVACPDDSFDFTGKGINMLDEETGYSVAELVERSLYIHHDICHTGKSSEIEIFRKICKRMVFLLKPNKDTEKDIINTFSNEPAEKKHWLKKLTRPQLEALERLAEKIETVESVIDDLKKGLEKKAAELQDLKREQLILSRLLQSEKKKQALMYEQITELPEVFRIIVDTDQINVLTNNITARYGDKNLKLGRYLIKIGIHSGTLMMLNISRVLVHPVMGIIHHPHIDENGVAIAGNLEQSVAQLIADNQYFILIENTIRYLKTIDESEPGGNLIADWINQEDAAEKSY